MSMPTRTGRWDWDTMGRRDGEATEAALAARLVSTLEPVVGVDKIRASVNVDYDQGSTDESQQKYDPTVSARVERTEDAEPGARPRCGAGTVERRGRCSGNCQQRAGQLGARQTSPAQSPGQTSTSESAQYGVNKTETHTVVPAGRIQRVTAAIVVDDAVVRNVVGGKVSLHQAEEIAG